MLRPVVPLQPPVRVADYFLRRSFAHSILARVRVPGPGPILADRASVPNGRFSVKESGPG